MKFRVSDDLALADDLVVSTAGIFATKGMGKCLSPETPVLLYDGRIVDAATVHVGDYLMGPDSRPRRVLDVTRGFGPMFEILPVKGDSWRCNDAHVLTLKHTTTGAVIDIPVADFIEKTPTFQREQMLFMTGVDFAPAERLPLSPYFLGLWFGDGDKTTTPELGLLRVAVTTGDDKVRDACAAIARQFDLKLVRDEHKRTPRYRIVNERGGGNYLLELLRSIVGIDLVVPHRYLVASRADRLEFLAGWLDSDGSLECGCFDFVQKRGDWTDAVMFLARSLGFRATVAPKVIAAETYHRVCISGDIAEIPTRLVHKRAEPRRQRKDHQRTGFKVVPVDDGPYSGFMVDGDGRFLLGDFTVTHNSHIAQVMAEEMLEHDQVIVAIDPTDAWSGLLSSADGKSDGYPILVIGGDHGHLKLDPEPGAGVRLAEAIVAERFSCVICTKGLDDTPAIRYVREVLQTLFLKNREPLHIFVDEADIFAPQQPKEQEDHRCIRALAHVVRRGRKQGLGSTLITQRPSELNATVRSQVEMLFVLGLMHNLDIDAVEKWMRLRKKKKGDNAAYALREEMIESLDTLQRGDAWLWAPRLKLHKRFRARAKRTFDSGATPKPGQKARKAKKLAAVDIARLGTAITEAARRQKENDPAELKKQLVALRREMDRAGKGQDRAEANEKALHADSYGHRARIAELEKQLAAAKKVKETIVEVIKPADLRRLEALVKKIDKLILRITGTNADLELHLSGLRGEATRLQEIATRVTQLRGKKAGALVGEVLAMAPEAPIENSWSKGDPLHHAYVTHPPKGGKRAPSAATPEKTVKPPAVKAPKAPAATNGHAVDAPEGIKPVHLRFLSAIAWWESIGVPSPDLGGVAFVAGTSTKSSAFDNNRSRLRAGGYIHYPSNGRVALTAAGRAITPPPELPPTNDALHEAVFQQLTPVLGRMLRPLIDAYPGELSLEDLAKQAGTSTSSSAFDNNRSWLRARGLADYPRTGYMRATELLFPEA